MSSDVSAVTEPLTIIRRNRRNTPPLSSTSNRDLANMSRRRFVTVQVVTVITAFITLITMVAVTLFRNEDLQERILNWGQTARCVSENLDNNNNNTGMEFLLKLSNQCAAKKSFSPP